MRSAQKKKQSRTASSAQRAGCAIRVGVRAQQAVEKERQESGRAARLAGPFENDAPRMLGISKYIHALLHARQTHVRRPDTVPSHMQMQHLIKSGERETRKQDNLKLTIP